MEKRKITDEEKATSVIKPTGEDYDKKYASDFSDEKDGDGHPILYDQKKENSKTKFPNEIPPLPYPYMEVSLKNPRDGI